MISASKTIVCYGDSNTHGYNSANMGRFTEKERWTCLLANLLGPGYLVREEGLSGRTTSSTRTLSSSAGTDMAYASALACSYRRT